MIPFRFRKSLIMIAAALLAMLACSKSEDKYLSINQMKKLIWDLSKVEAFHTYYLQRDSTLNADSVAKVKYAMVFSLHKVKSEAFFTTIDYYRSNPAKLKVLMDSVNTYGSRIREQGASGDTPTPPPVKKIME